MANLIVDDEMIDLSGLGGEWNVVTDRRYFGGSAMYPTLDTSTDPWLSFSFTGTALLCGNFNTLTMEWLIGTGIFLYGNKFDPNRSKLQDRPSPTAPVVLYHITQLPEGAHSVNVSSRDTVDFAVIVPGPSTFLRQQTLIVDDSDPAISYQGQWEQYGQDNPSSPYRISTHRATTAGPRATFRFSGRHSTFFRNL
jgi:hypothetical protein